MTNSTYNGHKNWAYWNVSLWLSNDEPFYRLVCDCIAMRDEHGDNAATEVIYNLHARGITHTPDGAQFTYDRVNAHISGLED